MKSLLAVLLVVAVSVPAAQQASSPRAGSPVAFVSVQRILSESPRAKEAAKQLEAFQKTRSEQVSQRQKALEATRLALANAGGLFQGSRRAELQEQEKKQQAELQQAIQQGQADLQKLQADLQEGTRRELTAAVDGVARRRGVQLVLNTDTAVVWAATGADLTSEVLAQLASKVAKAEKAAKKEEQPSTR